MPHGSRPYDTLPERAGVLEALVQSAPVAILILDLDMRVTMWNPSCERMFGWTAEEILGKPYPLVPDGEWEQFVGFYATVIEGEGFTGVEAMRHRKDGSELYVAISTAPIRGKNGRVTGAMAILEDVTERRLLEEHLRQSQKMEAVGRLAGGIAHDFNNVLTVILSYTDALLITQDPKRILSDVQAIQRAAERAAELTRQLLAFSRRQVLQSKLIDLNELLEGSVDLLGRLIGEDIRIDLHLDPSIGPVRADPAQLERLLMNLAANARDAMPDGGVLTLKSGKASRQENPSLADGRWVGFCVCDTGAGMDSDTLEHLFEPFFTTKELGRGTGLGLASVWGIVRQSGGEVDVRSELGVGTEFRVYFPEAIDPGGRPREDEDPDELTMGAGATILVVEDDDDVRQVVERVLGVLDFRVISAASGPEALEKLAALKGPLDLLLTDVVMAGMSGREVAKRVRAMRPEVRLLFMSGYTDDEVLRRGVDRGANFLHKPFTTQQLVLAIRQVLDG